MSALRAVLLALLVVGGSLAVAAPTSATVDSRVDSTRQSDATAAGEVPAPTDGHVAAVQRTDATQNDTTQNDDENSSLGGDISSFMQSSTAEIDGAVETGMWSAAFNATNDRSEQRQLVERRTDHLRAELDDLRERKAALVAERDEGNASEVAYKARIGNLLGRIEALQSAINATEPRARQAGTSVEALEMLESDAKNLTGPEIAEIARNTNGVGNGTGSPDGVGNGNGSDSVGGPPENAGSGNGPLGDAGNGSETDLAGPPNETAAGPPDDVGNGNADAPGNGNGTGADLNAATPGSNGSDRPGGSAVSRNLTAESFAFEPITNAVGARTAVALRTLPLS